MIEVTVKYPGKDHVFLCSKESADWLAAQFARNEWVDVVQAQVAEDGKTRAKEQILAHLDNQFAETVVSKYATMAECNAARNALTQAVLGVAKL